MFKYDMKDKGTLQKKCGIFYTKSDPPPLAKSVENFRDFFLSQGTAPKKHALKWLQMASNVF